MHESAGDLESRIWRTYVDLKIEKIRESLFTTPGNTDGYVFHLFKEQVDAFINWLLRAELHRFDDFQRKSTIKVLDDLAVYLRFFESASQQVHVPFALVEHVVALCGSVERGVNVLLRPQNVQTFETRKDSLQTLLGKLAAAISTPEYSLNDLQGELQRFPDIYVVSYPKYLSEFFPLYPILGHELGHVLWTKRKLNEKAIAIVSKQLKQRLHQKLAISWGTELFCDRIGLHLYGETYIYALWLFLLPFEKTLELPALDELEAMYWSESLEAMEAIGKVFKELEIVAKQGNANDEAVQKAREKVAQFALSWLESVKGKRDEELSYPDEALTYPSPGRRLRQLVEALPGRMRIKPKGQFFSIFKAFEQYDEENSEEYKEIRTAAMDLCAEIYGELRGELPAAVNPANERAVVDQLTRQLEQWVPPVTCEIDGNESAAEWPQVLLAGWLRFAAPGMENTSAELLEFMYDSLEMNNYYRHFKAISVAMKA